MKNYSLRFSVFAIAAIVICASGFGSAVAHAQTPTPTPTPTSTATPSPSPMSTATPTPTPVTVPTTTPVHVTCFTFARNLGVGSSGNDVSMLQSFLQQQGYLGTTGSDKGSFNENMAAAVVKYQAANGIPSTGFFGPITRAKVNSIYGCSGTTPIIPPNPVVIPPTPIAPPPTPPTAVPCPAGYTCTPANQNPAPVCPAGYTCTPVNSDPTTPVYSNPTPPTDSCTYNCGTPTTNPTSISWSSSNSANPNSVEGQLRAQGKSWVKTSGMITAGAYVQDILEGRLDQPQGRGAIGKVLYTVTNTNGQLDAMVDFGNGYQVGIHTSELALVSVSSPVSARFIWTSSDPANTNSIEGQLRAQGKSWTKVSGMITTGTYVQDTLEGRLDQPQGRGAIGMVLYTSSASGQPAAMVDFGNGYQVGINLSELSPVNVSGAASYGQAPVITGGSAPTALAVGQAGTWNINAYDPQNGQLTYSVNWGDTVSAMAMGVLQKVSQTSTFTHTYYTAGTYTITFTVSNSSGQTTQSSSMVTVGNSVVTPTPAVVSLDSTSPLTSTVLATNPSSGQYLGLPVLVFDIQNNNGSVGSSDYLRSLTVRFSLPGNLAAAYLYQGTTLIQSASIYGGVASFQGISNTASGAAIPANVTVPYMIKVDVTGVNTGGVVVSASVPAGGVTILDGNGNNLAVNGSAQGSSITVMNSNTTAAVSNPASVSASVVDASSDKAGAWGVFGPGAGRANNGGTADFHWTAAISSAGTRAIQSMTLTASNSNAVWSTSDSNKYPLVVYMNGIQVNSSYGVSFGTLQNGAGTFDLYGQPEFSTAFSGGTLTVAFTDGTSATANIPASTVRPMLPPPTGATQTSAAH